MSTSTCPFLASPRSVVSLALLLLAALGSSAVAQTAPFVLPVSSPAGITGAIAPLGDVDGDGHPDLLVALPGGTSAAPGVALVRVVSGDDLTVLLELTEGASDEDFGLALAPVGDLDGDGFDDFVVGAPGGPLSTQPGRVHAFSGATGTLLWTATGAMAADGFGHALAGFGDQDGDDVPDVFVGAPRDGTAGALAGRCAVLSGVDGSLLGQAFGAAAGDALGWSLSAATPDHVWMHQPEPWVGATQSGNGGAGYARRLSRIDLSTLDVVTGSQTLDRFGASVRVIGDADGDGDPDVLIGADPKDATGTPLRPGFARLHSGADGALIREHVSEASAPGTGFGGALAALGDLDGDDVPDYAFGEPLLDEAGSDAGALHVISGASGVTLHTLHGAAADARLGARVSAVGDVDGDGLRDLLVTSRSVSDDAFWVTCVSFTPWESFSNGTAGTYGMPGLSGRGGLLPGSTVSLLLDDALENAAVTLFLGMSLMVDPVQGVICPLPSAVIALSTDGTGATQYDFAWPEGMPAGTVVYYQMRVADPVGVNGEALSNTLSATAPEPAP